MRIMPNNMRPAAASLILFAGILAGALVPAFAAGTPTSGPALVAQSSPSPSPTPTQSPNPAPTPNP